MPLSTICHLHGGGQFYWWRSSQTKPLTCRQSLTSFIRERFLNVVKSKKIEEAKRVTEAVNRRRIDNTMVKRKSIKGQTNNNLQNCTLQKNEREKGWR